MRKLCVHHWYILHINVLTKTDRNFIRFGRFECFSELNSSKNRPTNEATIKPCGWTVGWCEWIHSRKLTWRAPKWGLEKVTPFKHSNFWVSMLDFWGVAQNSPKKIGMSKVKVAINHSGWILFCLTVFFWVAMFKFQNVQTWEPFKHRSQHKTMGWTANH